MWAELLVELVYGVLDHPTIESVHSLNHWNLVVCEDPPVENDPQKQLELVSPCQNYERELLTTVFPSHSKELVSMFTKQAVM